MFVRSLSIPLEGLIPMKILRLTSVLTNRVYFNFWLCSTKPLLSASLRDFYTFPRKPLVGLTLHIIGASIMGLGLIKCSSYLLYTILDLHNAGACTRWRIVFSTAWWRHQMEQSSALLAICAGNSPVSGEFPAQRPVTRSFDVFFASE